MGIESGEKILRIVGGVLGDGVYGDCRNYWLDVSLDLLGVL